MVLKALPRRLQVHRSPGLQPQYRCRRKLSCTHQKERCGRCLRRCAFFSTMGMLWRRRAVHWWQTAVQQSVLTARCMQHLQRRSLRGRIVIIIMMRPPCPRLPHQRQVRDPQCTRLTRPCKLERRRCSPPPATQWSARRSSLLQRQLALSPLPRLLQPLGGLLRRGVPRKLALAALQLLIRHRPRRLLLRPMLQHHARIPTAPARLAQVRASTDTATSSQSMAGHRPPRRCILVLRTIIIIIMMLIIMMMRRTEERLRLAPMAGSMALPTVLPVLMLHAALMVRMARMDRMDLETAPLKRLTVVTLVNPIVIMITARTVRMVPTVRQQLVLTRMAHHKPATLKLLRTAPQVIITIITISRISTVMSR